MATRGITGKGLTLTAPSLGQTVSLSRTNVEVEAASNLYRGGRLWVQGTSTPLGAQQLDALCGQPLQLTHGDAVYTGKLGSYSLNKVGGTRVTLKFVVDQG